MSRAIVDIFFLSLFRRRAVTPRNTTKFPAVFVVLQAARRLDVFLSTRRFSFVLKQTEEFLIGYVNLKSVLEKLRDVTDGVTTNVGEYPARFFFTSLPRPARRIRAV